MSQIRLDDSPKSKTKGARRPKAEHIIQSPAERNRARAKASFISLQKKLNVKEDVVKQSIEMLNLAMQKKITYGRPMQALMASVFYISCRMAGERVTLKDIQDATNTKKKDVSRCYRLILREFDIKVPLVDPVSCVQRIGEQASITLLIRKEAERILREYEKSGASAGKDPMGLAAAALYYVCERYDKTKTQKIIASAAEVSEVTVRNRYRGLLDSLES